MSDAHHDSHSYSINYRPKQSIENRIKSVLETIKTKEMQAKQIEDDIKYSKAILAELIAQQAGAKYRGVQRKAKAGDTILVVKDEFSGGYYQVGEILKVLARHDGWVYVDKTYETGENDNVRLTDYDYVVLEEIDS